MRKGALVRVAECQEGRGEGEGAGAGVVDGYPSPPHIYGDVKWLRERSAAAGRPGRPTRICDGPADSIQ